MLMLTAVRADGSMDLLIVLGDDNMERVKQYDPAQIEWHKLPQYFSRRLLNIVAVGYATASEMEQIKGLASQGRQAEAFALVTRGFKYRPEAGDHDFGPTLLGRPTEGVKL
jgi:hypothetical protein